MNPALIQGSPEWLALRRTKITSADASAIMGVSKWSSAYSIWLDKLGFGEPKQDNFAMQRGRELEPIARELFINETGIMVVPEVIFSNEYDFMMSSLDGIDFSKEVICEIKVPGQEDHQMALDGVIPEHYMPQLNHQMITAGVKKCFYVSFTPASYKILEVYLNEEEAKTLIKKEKEFFNCIQNLTPPPFTEKDYIQRSDQEWTTRAKKLKQLTQQRKELEMEEEMIKKELIELSGGFNCQSEEIKLSKVIRLGSIDYKNVDELKNVNLNAHRKPNTIYYRIS